MPLAQAVDAQPHHTLSDSVPLPSVPAATSGALAQLAHIAYDQPSGSPSFVASILQLLAESLSIAQVHVTRIEGNTLHFERVFDQGGIAVHEGDEIPLAESYCQVMLEMAAPSLIVEDALADDRFAGLACTSAVGIGAYSGVPLYHTNGRLYGTLCTLHPQARAVSSDEPMLLSLAGRIVMQAIEADEARGRLLEASETTAVAFQASTERYRTVVQCSPDAIVVTDVAGVIVLSNQQAAEMFACIDADALMGVSVIDCVVPEDRQRAAEALRQRTTLAAPQGSATEYRLLRRDGSTFSAEISSSALLNDEGHAIGLTVVVRDISERKLFEQELQHQALYDALTDLPNRTLFQETLQQLLQSTRREDSSCALLLLDLDGFKELNDTFGHELGDHVLQQLARRLQATSRASDLVARLGGDEFAVLLPRTDAANTVHVVEKIHAALRIPVEVDDQHLAIDGSIGIALYPEDGQDATTLLRHADVAMYAAKRTRSAYMLYDAEQDRESKRRLALSQTLRDAIETQQFILHYQPKVDLRSGVICGAEALIRWQHPQFGLVSPDDFIPIAEQSSLITPLTRWIFAEALGQVRRWQELGLDLQVAVNLSARSLHDHHVVEMIAEALQHAEARPAWLIIEITESQIMVDPAHALHALKRLQAMGVTVAIDDFGTGYSSLAYLDTLPAKELKIDHSFILDMDTNLGHRRIVEATINLAHDLQLQTVAEGVETQRTLDLLESLGCDTVQGYHISRPIPGDALAEWIRSSIHSMSARSVASRSVRT